MKNVKQKKALIVCGLLLLLGGLGVAMAASDGPSKTRTVPKGWHILSRAEVLDGADSVVVMMRNAREGLYVRIRGDFDGNGRIDEAMYLKNEQGELGLFVAYSLNNGKIQWRRIKEAGVRQDLGYMALETIPGKPDVICEMELESASWAWHWDAVHKAYTQEWMGD